MRSVRLGREVDRASGLAIPAGCEPRPTNSSCRQTGDACVEGGEAAVVLSRKVGRAKWAGQSGLGSSRAS